VSARYLDPLSSDERARVAARWASADAFYRERDDRTRRGVGEVSPFAGRPVEIWADPLGDVTVQRIALVAANLTARWARRVRVVLPEGVALAEPLRRDGAVTLQARLRREMTLADPFGHWTIDTAHVVSRPPLSEPPLRLFVGPWGTASRAVASITLADDDYVVDARWWSALGARASVRNEIPANEVSDEGRREASVAAAGLAGALGAADLFKRAAGHPGKHWMPTFAWDMSSHTLSAGPDAWATAVTRPVPGAIDLGRTLLAGVGAIGSAFVYLADLSPLSGSLTLFDRDRIEVTNLNRAPLFNVLHALDEPTKPDAVADYLAGRGVAVTPIVGPWREHAATLATEPFDVWVSLTNEDGAWATVPFALPPVVLHGTTTSGWGFGVGRHVPRREDCTLCRMPRPQAEFRGPCAEGELHPVAGVSDRDGGRPAEPPRASLPFLSAAAAALLLAERMKLDHGATVLALPNEITADLSTGLPAVVTLNRGPRAECRGCRATQSAAWARRGSSGRYDTYSL
jgi:hypothetical protein